MKFVVILLVVGLVGSNAFWFMKIVDCGLSLTYQRDSFEDSQLASIQLLQLVNTKEEHRCSKREIVPLMEAVPGSGESFEKEGYVWVGALGFKFNEENKLISARRAIEM